MSGLFDSISRRLEAEAEDRGITAMDLAQLPPPLRLLMRRLLREVELTYPELRRLARHLPPEDGLTQAELDQALEKLLQQAWIVRMGQDDLITYRVNLRRKRGSRLDSSLWETLDRRLGRE